MAKARISTFMHCRNCMKITIRKDGTKKITSTEQLAVGWTPEGIQVVCETCDTSIIDLDFFGQKIGYYSLPEEKVDQTAS